MEKPCPWCGHTLTGALANCEKCGWTRERPNTRPAILAYLVVVLACTALGIIAFQWVKRETKGYDTQVNQIISPAEWLRKEAL